jgi:hypothetical protein
MVRILVGDEENLVEFMAKLRSCFGNIGKGIYASSGAESLKHYGTAFGKTFPAS